MNDSYTKIKNHLITSSELDELEYRILSYMLSIQNDGKCYPSIRTMANKFGKSTTTISKYLKSLEEKGFIKKANRTLGTGKKTSNEYLIDEDIISKNKKKSVEEKEELEKFKEENEKLKQRLEQLVLDYDWLEGNTRK